jgi:hypothetical protein
MTVTTVVLIPYTEHGVPSGNYDGSSLEFFGDPQKAANYYRGRGGLQTVIFRIINFVGSVTVQATLDADPANAVWFDSFSFGDDGSTQDGSTTDTFPANIVGNFTWLRVRVDNFTTGTIELITATY